MLQNGRRMRRIAITMIATTYFTFSEVQPIKAIQRRLCIQSANGFFAGQYPASQTIPLSHLLQIEGVSRLYIY
jgi:hypothetical protein